MKRWTRQALSGLLIILGGLACAATPAFAGTDTAALIVQDPMADYLSMNVPDRTANAGSLLVVKRVTVDIGGNSQREVFIGTWYRRSGPNTWLWVGYAPVPGGYHRITPADSDVLIDFNQIYIGFIPDLGRQGMVQGYSLELDNQERAQSNLLSDVTYYYLDDGEFVEKGTGPLDREDPEGQRRYDYFFGPNRRVRDHPIVEAFSVEDLVRQGYRLPGPSASKENGVKRVSPLGNASERVPQGKP
ncbi:MAG TPA: hypothetical protein VGD78_06280 [Chthoniobacterales bacterium]